MTNKIDTEKIMTMKKDGYSIQEIAQELNLEEDHIKKYIEQKEYLEKFTSNSRKYLNVKTKNKYNQMKTKTEKSYDELKKLAINEMKENTNQIRDRRVFIEAVKKRYKNHLLSYDDILLTIEIIKGNVGVYTIENVEFISNCLTDLEKYEVAIEFIEYCMIHYRTKYGFNNLFIVKNEVNQIWNIRRAIEMVDEGKSLNEIKSALNLDDEDLEYVKEAIGRFLVDSSKNYLKDKYEINKLPKKSLKNLYEYFNLYSKEDIDTAIEKLSDSYKEILFKYYSKSLLRLKATPFLTKDGTIFYSQIIKDIKQNLKELKSIEPKKEKHNKKTNDLKKYFNLSIEDLNSAIELLSKKDIEFLYTYYDSNLVKLNIQIPDDKRSYFYNLLTKIKNRLGNIKNQNVQKVVDNGIFNKEKTEESNNIDVIENDTKLSEKVENLNEKEYDISYLFNYFAQNKIDIIELSLYMEISIEDLYKYRIGEKNIPHKELMKMLEYLDYDNYEKFVNSIPESYFNDNKVDRPILKENNPEKEEIIEKEKEEIVETEKEEIKKDNDEKNVETNENIDTSQNISVISNDEIIKVLEIFDTPEFVELTKTKSIKECVILTLKLGYIDGKYFSSKAIANFLNIDIEEVNSIVKNNLLEYKKYLMSAIDEMIIGAGKVYKDEI